MTPPPDGARGDRVYETAGQLERTALSWNRTLLALGVNGTLLVRMGTNPGAQGWIAVAGMVILAVTLLAWSATSRAYRRLRGRPARALLARRPYASYAALCVALVGLVDLLAVMAYG